jgi:hypothetical protein
MGHSVKLSSCVCHAMSRVCVCGGGLLFLLFTFMEWCSGNQTFVLSTIDFFCILCLYISPFLWVGHKVTKHHAWVVGTPAYSVGTLFKGLAFLLIIQLVLCLNICSKTGCSDRFPPRCLHADAEVVPQDCNSLFTNHQIIQCSLTFWQHCSVNQVCVRW